MAKSNIKKEKERREGGGEELEEKVSREPRCRVRTIGGGEGGGGEPEIFLAPETGGPLNGGTSYGNPACCLRGRE